MKLHVAVKAPDSPQILHTVHSICTDLLQNTVLAGSNLSIFSTHLIALQFKFLSHISLKYLGQAIK